MPQGVQSEFCACIQDGNALTPSGNTVTYDLPGSPLPKNQRPIVVGVDGSETFAKEAREEGFDHIADLFEMIGAIEKEHEERYRRLLKNVEDKLVFSRDGDCVWQCSNCGHIVVGRQAPEVCPVCAHPKAYFELKADNY